jgi:soluble lytic murein transglycosylase-like protein
MKKFALALTFALGCALPALAQTAPGYQFDNFDLANGIRVVTPQQTAHVKRNKRPARLSANNESVETKGDAAPKTLTHLASMAVSRSLDSFTTGNANVDGLIVESGTRNGVDPVLLYAIMHQESTFKQRAVSPKGARGLMQLMPGTAARYGVTNIFDPRQNIEGGARYMRFLLDLFDGDVELALAGYNAGEGAVMKYGNRIPPYSETQEYVRRIGRRYALMRDPLTAQYANRASREQLAAIQGKQSAPLTIYERSISAIRLPDGRLQLVSQ